jgi:hypothetical protein
LRTTTHLVRRGACAAALALLAVGAASAPALATAASPATLTASDGVGGDLFGESTATSATGAVTVVGAPEHHSSGAAYVFTRSGTTFSQSAELFPGNPLADEQFGQTVAISGNGQTLVAAAPGAAGPGVSDQGAAYVFSDASGSWTQIAELTARGTSELGTSLAISSDGSTIVAGAPLSNSDNGEAFVFTKSGGTYVRAQKLTVPASQSLALLGTDTAISSDGSTIAFGEPQNGVTDVFTKAAGASTWKQTAQLHGGGDSVAVSSNGKIVAAGQTGINDLNGAAFVFTKSGGIFTEASEVLPPANTTKAAFAAGTTIGISASGSIVAFGAPTATAGTAFESGEVFVATETSTGTWKRTATDAEPHPVSDDDLGGGDQSVSVVGNGTAIVAGARDANGQTGRAIVFPVR